MTMYLPEIYPDELVYSWLARYYIQTGYVRYAFVAEELFQSKIVRPDIEFVNQYTTPMLQAITEKMPMSEIIENHTMFPYYGRFLQKERRNRAYTAMIQTKGNYHNLLPMPKRKGNTDRYLRYCPVCAENDRKQYGEAYWHRIHQLQGVNICPIHKCYLINSAVRISGKASPTLVAAEICIPENNNDIVICQNNIERKTAVYVTEVFQSELDFQNDVTVGKFLHSRMESTPYRSVRGQQRNIAMLHADFQEYYKNLQDNSFSELWQIQKVLTDDRVNPYEVCMFAMFLNVPVEDLVIMELPEQTQEQRFDEQIYLLHKQGLKYPEIARQLGASYDTVKAIGEQRYKKYHKESSKALKCGIKAYDWQQIDKDTLPLVRDAIRKLQGNEKNRPKKVTVFAIEKLLHLPSKRITSYLPKCKAEIEKHYETQEEYWAREVVWAVKCILREGNTLNWKHIRNLTNMRKRDLMKCVPYLPKYVDMDMVDKIKILI